MFGLGIITDQISMDFEESLKAVKKLGLKYVEIHSLWDKNIEDLNKEEIKKVKSLLKSYDLLLSDISSTIFLQCSINDSPNDFPSLTDWFLTISGDFKKHLDALKKCISFCDELNTDKIRIFGFREDENKKENQKDEEIIDIISEKIGKAVEIAEKSGVTLIIENCPFTYLSSGMVAKKIIDKLNSNYLKCLWDPGNTMRSQTINAYPEDYNTIKDVVSHIHIKDINFITKKINNIDYNEENIVSIGKGLVNYDSIIRNLVKDGYEGIISLEPEYVLNNNDIEQRIVDIKENLNGVYNIIKK